METIEQRKNLKVWITQNRFLIGLIMLLVIRFLLVMGLPIFAHAGAGHDDRLMIGFADSILKGEWLGEYSEMTLVKGAMFPLVLVIDRVLGISYVLAMTAFYAAACLFFIYVLRDLIKSQLFLLLFFAFLLFNPVSFADETFFRVYRNALTGAQTLFIVASVFGLYLSRKASIKRMIFFGVMGGLNFSMFWHTREDGIWLLPFLAAALLITMVGILIEKGKLKEKTFRALIVMIPVFFLIISTLAISTVNNHYYGVFATNELNSDPFSKTIKMIYSIEDPVEADNVSVSREKMKMMYEFSPTLRGIQTNIEDSMNRWSWYDANEPVREVEDGWFFWSLREAVSNAGYYQNANTANTFYEDVYQELNAAVENGRLSQRPTMPSALMSPWRVEYTREYPVALLKTLYYIVNYREVMMHDLVSIDDGNSGIRLFEKITGNPANHPGETFEWIDLLKVKILNGITLIYKYTGLILFLFGGIGYLWTTIKMFNKKTRKKKNIPEIWLLMTALMASILVLMLGVAYTDISAYVAISYWYLTGAYPLMIAFEALGLLMGFSWWRGLKKKNGKVKE